MTITKTYCDHCGREIRNFEFSYNHIKLGCDKWDFELCFDCNKELEDYLDDFRKKKVDE